MKTYMVAIHVSSQEASLNQISDVLGVDPGPGSCNKGDARGKPGNKCRETVSKLESFVEEGAEVEEHLTSLRAELPLSRLQDPRLPADHTVTLDIAVKFDTFYGSITLSAEQLRPFVDVGAGIEVTWYPTDFTEEPPDS